MAITTANWAWYDKGIKHIKPEDFLTEDIRIILIDNTYIPNAATHEFYDVSMSGELTTANGYTAGGLALTGKSLIEGTAGTWKFASDDPVWGIVTASLTAKLFAMYNNTPSSNKPLLCYGYLDWNGGTPVDVVTLVGANLTLLLGGSYWFTMTKVNS